MTWDGSQALKFIESFFLPPIKLIEHDLRLVGPTLQALNFLTFFKANHCQGQYFIRADTFLSSGGNALWLVISPDPKTILSGLLRPKSYRKYKRFEKEASKLEGIITDSKIAKVLNKDGKFRGGFRLLFEDKGTLVGDTIASAFKGIKKVAENNVGRALFKVIDIDLTIGWYAFLAEVTEEGIINWASSVIKIEAAESCGLASFVGSADNAQGGSMENMFGSQTTYTTDVNEGWAGNALGVSRSSAVKGYAVSELTVNYEPYLPNIPSETWNFHFNVGNGTNGTPFTLYPSGGIAQATCFTEFDSLDSLLVGASAPSSGTGYNYITASQKTWVLADPI